MNAQLAKLNKGLPRIYGESLYQDLEKPWRWQLTQAVTIFLSNGYELTIPAGYITDFATVPRLLRGVVATQGNHTLAALIHDWLYDTKYDGDLGNWKRDRKFADMEMLMWMEHCDSSKIKRYTIYTAVRVGGRKWWLN